MGQIQFCVHGHDVSICGRNTQRHCRQCSRNKVKAYHSTEEGKRKAREYAVRRYRENPAHREKCKAAQRERWRMLRQDPERMREMIRRSSEHGRLSRLRKIEGAPLNRPDKGTCCAICGKCAKQLHLDHCHKANRFRGWLCFRCNAGLGLFQDSEDLLQRAIGYLGNR